MQILTAHVGIPSPAPGTWYMQVPYLPPPTQMTPPVGFLDNPEK